MANHDPLQDKTTWATGGGLGLGLIVTAIPSAGRS